jgi:hypothetical protein
MIHTKEHIDRNFAQRFPNADKENTIDLHAAAAGVDEIQAAAVHSGAPGKQVYVKAKENFYQRGTPIMAGDFVQVPESDAKVLKSIGRADFATADEVAEAQKASSKK